MPNKKIPIDLMVFDFDGTLANSIPPAVDAIQFMLKELGLPYKTKEEINSHVGYGEVPLVSGSIGSKDPDLIGRAMTVYVNRYISEGIKDIPLYPGVKETLAFFKDKKKAIISNKSDHLIKLILANLKLTDYFCEVLGGDTAPCLKPDPCVVNRIIRDNAISKNRTIFIGDMTVDIETGKNAGVLTCAVTYGFDSREKLRAAQPDFLINSFGQLKEIMV